MGWRDGMVEGLKKWVKGDTKGDQVMTWWSWIGKDVLFYSGGKLFWNTIKETMNFLLCTMSSTSGDEGKGNSNVRGAVEGDGHHRIWYSWYSEFKIVIPSDEGIIESRLVLSGRHDLLLYRHGVVGRTDKEATDATVTLLKGNGKTQG
jgi:hypothetical protein